MICLGETYIQQDSVASGASCQTIRFNVPCMLLHDTSNANTFKWQGHPPAQLSRNEARWIRYHIVLVWQTRHHHRSVSSQSSVDAQIARSMASRHILMRADLRVYFDVWRLIAYSQKGYALRLCIITLFKCFSCSHARPSSCTARKDIRTHPSQYICTLPFRRLSGVPLLLPGGLCSFMV